MRAADSNVADIRSPRCRTLPFVRSPLAHARIRGIAVPERYRGQPFSRQRSGRHQAIRAVSPYLPALIRVSMEQPSRHRRNVDTRSGLAAGTIHQARNVQYAPTRGLTPNDSRPALTSQAPHQDARLPTKPLPTRF